MVNNILYLIFTAMAGSAIYFCPSWYEHIAYIQISELFDPGHSCLASTQSLIHITFQIDTNARIVDKHSQQTAP